MSRSKHRLAASARPGRVLALTGHEMRQLPSTSTSQSARTLPSPSRTVSCNDTRRDSQKVSTAKKGCLCPKALSTPTVHELSSDTAKPQALSQRAWRLLFHGAIRPRGPRLDRTPALGVPWTRPRLTPSPSPLLSPTDTSQADIIVKPCPLPHGHVPGWRHHQAFSSPLPVSSVPLSGATTHSDPQSRGLGATLNFLPPSTAHPIPMVIHTLDTTWMHVLVHWALSLGPRPLQEGFL